MDRFYSVRRLVTFADTTTPIEIFYNDSPKSFLLKSVFISADLESDGSLVLDVGVGSEETHLVTPYSATANAGIYQDLNVPILPQERIFATHVGETVPQLWLVVLYGMFFDGLSVHYGR